MNNQKNKHKFPIKILEERLEKEKSWLRIFEKPAPINNDFDGPSCNIEECRKFLEWKNKNIESCLYRINELEETIKYLNLKNQDIQNICDECCDSGIDINNEYIGKIFQWLIDNDYKLNKI